jgi:hypothetical protein
MMNEFRKRKMFGSRDAKELGVKESAAYFTEFSLSFGQG